MRSAALLAVLALMAGTSTGCAGTSANGLPIGMSVPKSGTELQISGWSLSQAAFNRAGDLAALAFNARTLAPQVILITGKTGTALTPTEWIPGAFAWMPDNASVLVSRMSDPRGATDLVVYGKNGMLERTIKPDVPLTVDAGLDVTPDGSFAIAGAHAPGLGTSNTDLYKIRLSDGRVQRLTNTVNVAENGPHVANQTVVYSAYENGLTSPEVGGQVSWIGEIDLNGLRGRAVTERTSATNDAAVSFDGRFIVFQAVASAKSPNHRGLWAVPVAGGEAHLILTHPAGGAPALTPSGQGVWLVGTDSGSALGRLVYQGFSRPL